MVARRGIVYLVGAGPGDPGLITVRGLEMLRRADVVVHDRLVAEELLDEVTGRAELIDVGKAPGRHACSQEAINALLIDRASRGHCVVRLKGGDPFVFGRGGEELQACRAAGIECVVVPGVSSALAAPAAAGIPVTHRNVARSFTVVAARTGRGGRASGLNYAALAASDTIVIMMGRANLHEIARGLIQAGKDPATPAACIENASTPHQRQIRADLATIAASADRAGLQAPVVTVVGEVAAITSQATVVRTSSLVDNLIHNTV